MSIAHYDPTEPVTDQQPLAVVHDERKFAVYDNQVHPTYALEASMEGKPWTLEAFYGQILGVNDNVKDLDIGLEAAYQHYEKIEKYELLLDGTLVDSFDSKSQLMTTGGSGTTYSFHKANRSDYFTAVSNMGRLGLFKVIDTGRFTHEKHSTAKIEFQLVTEIAPGNALFENLESKVSVTKVFSKARLIENLNPILLKKTFTEVRNLGVSLRTLANDYFRTFYRQERGTLFIPGQDKYIYDPFVVTFFNRVVDSNMVPDKQLMLLLSDDNDPVYKTNTIWTLLQRRGIENLPYSNTVMMMVPPTWFDHVILAKSAYFANTDFTLYPRNHDRSAEITRRKSDWGVESTPNTGSRGAPRSESEAFEVIPTTDAFGDHIDYTQLTMQVGGKTIALYKQVKFNTAYIFDRHFFDEEPATVLEIALLDYIRRDNISVDQIVQLVKTYPKLNRLEQFYYGPMLMVMLREVIRGAYA